MLDENEKRDLLVEMSSDSRRLDFETMRRNSAPRDPRRMDIDALIDFLEAALRLANPPAARPAPRLDYPRPLI